MIIRLEEDLEQIATTPEPSLMKNRLAIRKCRWALVELRKLVVHTGFPAAQDEIRFFKEIKPLVCSKLMYYQSVFQLETTRLELDQESFGKHLQRERKRIVKYLKKHKEDVQYYQCGYTHFDEKYFLRDNASIPLEVKASQLLMDEDFSTWYDLRFAQIIANQQLLDYISTEIKKREQMVGKESECPEQSRLKWTGNKIDLYEMIYAIYFDGSVNNGKATIRDLAQAFEWMFNTELQKGIYKTQDQLENRIDPVKYLSHLVAILRRRIDRKLQ